MKIAILTQPLGRNYGGLLQAFALQAYLKKMGCEVITLDRKKPEKNLISIKQSIVLLFKSVLGKFQKTPLDRTHEYVFSYLYSFRSQRLNLTALFTSDVQVNKHFKDNQYDLIVIGSDQVWRPKYSPSIGNFFCDFFGSEKKTVPCISYAASFGVDNWEFANEETLKCKQLINNFDAVTVREDAAVNLCKTYLNVDAKRVVDPTLLLAPEDYSSLIPVQKENRFANKVVAYVLDPEKSKQNIAQLVAKTLGKDVAQIMPEKKSAIQRILSVNPEQYPPVEDWLLAFKSASFVVTDSFHGCIFSILFNKPFIAVGNVKRGLARFETLLKMFNLQDRLILSYEDLDLKKMHAEIDWKEVNQLRLQNAQEGKDFLNAFIDVEKFK